MTDRHPTSSKNSPAAKFEGGVMAVWCEDAVKHPEFPKHAFSTYIALCRFAGAKDSKKPGVARVRQDTLAACFNMSERTVRKHVKDLTDAGFVASIRTGRSSAYVIAGARSNGRVVIGADMSPRAVAAREAEAGDLATSILSEAVFRRENQRTGVAILTKVAARLLAFGHSGDDIYDVIVTYLNEDDAQIPTVSACLKMLSSRG
ncbi:hypothetical protein GCM10022215_15200 [Nocardioides fonticola]|uniref:Helix-turn-helix domain-containing protein n=1 Tax=Nocardioides fonticola TaxID=450363 RepID=A0ABP7XH44_9ACTN